MNKVMTIFAIITFPLMFAQFKAAWDQFTLQITSFAEVETDKEYREVHLPSKTVSMQTHAPNCLEDATLFSIYKPILHSHEVLSS